MIYFLYGNSLADSPRLAKAMFKDRAIQFSYRLGWNVSVDKNGEERDQYDKLNPLYVIAANKSGLHAGSMRFLPTVGQTMLNDYFSHLAGDVEIQSPLIWECTRFCLSEDADSATASALLAAGGKLMKELGILHFVGVFDKRMMRVYRRLGCSPTVLGWSCGEEAKVGVGLWEFSESNYQETLIRAGISINEMDSFFSYSDLTNKVRGNEPELKQKIDNRQLTYCDAG